MLVLSHSGFLEKLEVQPQPPSPCASLSSAMVPPSSAAGPSRASRKALAWCMWQSHWQGTPEPQPKRASTTAGEKHMGKCSHDPSPSLGSEPHGGVSSQPPWMFPFPSLRYLERRRLMTRSWRWWQCLGACRWPSPGSSNCSITGLRRCVSPLEYAE